MTAFLTILAMGLFGVVIAVVSQVSLSRERKALLEARARLKAGAEGKGVTEAKALSTKEQALAALVLTGGVGGTAFRPTRTAPKQYRRVQAK